MDNIVIPDAPATAPITEAIPYCRPKLPFYGDYTRISFDIHTGEMIKDKYIKSKNTAFTLQVLGLVLGIFFFPFFGMGDFYCGRIGRGLLKMFTAGGLYILAVIDIIKVNKGEYETNGKCILL